MLNPTCAFQFLMCVSINTWNPPAGLWLLLLPKLNSKENECWTVFTSMNTDHKYALMHRSILWCIIQIYFIFQSDALHTNYQCNNIMCDIHRNHHCHRLRYKICTVKYHFFHFLSRKLNNSMEKQADDSWSWDFPDSGYIIPIPLLESSLG